MTAPRARLAASGSTGEATKTPTTTVGSPVGFDLEAMRLPPNYATTLAVKKAIVTVPVGKPDKTRFFRIRGGAEWTFGAYIVQIKEANETYVALPHVAPLLGSLARPVLLHTAIDRNGNVSLVPVFLPGEDGKRNQWHESFAQGVEIALTQWVRVTANMPSGAYDVLVAQAKFAEPDWPDTTLEELVKVGFRGKIIDREDHPVILALLGAV